MVGVSTALALQENGHQVVLLDRQAPGRETSYGNAGIIQTEAVEPYGFPPERERHRPGGAQARQRRRLAASRYATPGGAALALFHAIGGGALRENHCRLFPARAACERRSRAVHRTRRR
ncbi:FAD-dependent oxidoreductase [Ensifer canadensis]